MGTLNPNRSQVFSLHSRGLSNAEIAEETNYSPKSIGRMLREVGKRSNNRPMPIYRLEKPGTPEFHIRARVRVLKHRAKIEGIPFNLNADDLLLLFKEQNGRCFYTDQVLTFETGKKYVRSNFSVDKIEPEKGYTKDNIVLCTRKVNIIKNDVSLEEMKEWMPGWYRRVQARHHN